MLKISRKSDYGLLFLAYLARFYDSRLVSLTEAAEKNNIPLPYLRKLAGDLTKSKIIESREGVKGGYRLAKSPSETTISDVLSVFEKTVAPVACLDGRSNCRCESKCTD